METNQNASVDNSKLAPESNKVLATYKMVPDSECTVEELCDLLQSWKDFTGTHVSLDFAIHSHTDKFSFAFYVADLDNPYRESAHRYYKSLAELLTTEWALLRKAKARQSILFKRFN